MTYRESPLSHLGDARQAIRYAVDRVAQATIPPDEETLALLETAERRCRLAIEALTPPRPPWWHRLTHVVRGRGWVNLLSRHGTVTWLIWLLLILGAQSVPAQSRDWTTANRVLAATATLGLLADWTSTVDLARKGQQEVGWGRLLVGARPNVAIVNRVFAINTVVIAVAADRVFTNKRSPIPGLSWRNLFLGTVTLVEGYCGIRNGTTGGLRYNFNF